MIQPIGFIDLSVFTAHYLVKYKERMQDGILVLRGHNPDDPLDDVVVERQVLKEWKSARAALSRIQTGAGALLKTATPQLGKAWIEMLPGGHGTPWQQFEDDYAQDHIRTRTCMVPAPDCYSYSGFHRELLAVGVLNVVEHRILHSETNFSAYPRVHLVVDVKRPEPDAEEG